MFCYVASAVALYMLLVWFVDLGGYSCIYAFCVGFSYFPSFICISRSEMLLCF